MEAAWPFGWTCRSVVSSNYFGVTKNGALVPLVASDNEKVSLEDNSDCAASLSELRLTKLEMDEHASGTEARLPQDGDCQGLVTKLGFP